MRLFAIDADNNITTFPDAAYDLEVEGMGTLDLPFANGSQSVANKRVTFRCSMTVPLGFPVEPDV